MASNQLRIIGGQWRGRKLHFADGEGLRPTTDRIRETLFNWLQGMIEGARCLDLYAGSGALGLEALSRGAGELVFLEKNPSAVCTLRDNLALLKADRAQVIQIDTLQYLQGSSRPFDIIFVDPPFNKGLLQATLDQLQQRGWLAPGVRIYIEHANRGESFIPPEGWELLRSKQAGQVAYHLAICPLTTRE